MQKLRYGWAVLAVSLLLLGCSKAPEDSDNSDVKEYKLTGRIVSLDPNANIATIQHQEIVGWMMAMTMGFPVKDDAEYKALRPGEQITATVYVKGATEYWIGNIKEVSEPPAAEPAPGGDGK